MSVLFRLLILSFLLVACSKSVDDAGVQIPVTVSSIESTRAMVGDTVTIIGENFGKSQSAMNVSFSDMDATIIFFSSTETEILVPDVDSGELQVSLRGEEVYPRSFEVENES